MLLKQLSDKRVVQAACGEQHSLALTDRHDVYSWGRGFEGQLGIARHVKVASTPQYLKTFFQNPVQFVECGAFYSLAITHDNSLYGWGESRMGQLGLGEKHRQVDMPTRIPVRESEETVSAKASSHVSVKQDDQK